MMEVVTAEMGEDKENAELLTLISNGSVAPLMLEYPLTRAFNNIFIPTMLVRIHAFDVLPSFRLSGCVDEAHHLALRGCREWRLSSHGGVHKS